MDTFLAQVTAGGWGSGLEWMVFASFLVPIALLILIFWYGHRNTV